MSCEDLSTYFVDFVNGDLPEKAADEVRLHLECCAACRAEVDGLGAVWHALGELADEEPGEAVRERFYALLDTEDLLDAEAKTAAKPWRERWSRWLAGWWPEQPAVQAAMTAAALLLGLGAGLLLSGGASRGELAELRADVTSLNRLVSLSLLHQDSASSRLRGVSYSRRAAGDDEVVAALFDVVDADESVGVRLAALDVLARFAERPEVAEKLRASLLAQTSPLVQIALIDLLAESNGPETTRTLRELEATHELDETVETRIAEYLGPRA